MPTSAKGLLGFFIQKVIPKSGEKKGKKQDIL
jgi:hypothetical protein